MASEIYFKCLCVATSTPNNTRELPDDAEISVISPPQAEFPAIVSDDEVDEALRVLSKECHQQSHNVDVHEQSTLRLDTPDHSQSPRNDSRGSPDLDSRDENKKVHFDQRLNEQSKTSVLEESEIISSENTATDKSLSPRKQSLMPRRELVSASRKRSKSPVVVEYLGTGNEMDNSVSQEILSPRKQPKFQIFIQKSPRNASKTARVKQSQKTNKQLDWSNPQNSPLPKASQSSISSCECEIPKCPVKDINLENCPKTCLGISENNEELGSDDCQCQCFCATDELNNDLPENGIRFANCPKKNLSISEKNWEVGSDDCQCQCSCVPDDLNKLEHTTPENSTTEKSQWWVISPDEIKKSLEAIRQSFLSKVEDNANILYNSLVYPPCAESSNNTGQSENFPSPSSIKENTDMQQIKEDSNFLIHPDSAHLNIQDKHNMLVSIQLSNKTSICRKCEMAGRSGDCKGGDNRCHGANFEAMDPEKTVSSQGTETKQSNKGEICRKCQLAGRSEDCKAGDDGCHGANFEAKDPEKTDSSQGTETNQSNKGAICRKCQLAGRSEDCKAGDDGCHGANFEAKDPAKTDSSQGTETKQSNKGEICRKCQLAGRSEDCKGGDDGCHGKKFEAKDPDKTDKSERAESQKSNKDDICRKCELAGRSEDCKVGYDGCCGRNIGSKDPNTTYKSQGKESQFFRDINALQTPNNVEKIQEPGNICDPNEKCKESQVEHDSEKTQTKHKFFNLLQNKPSSSDVIFHHIRQKSVKIQVPHGSGKCDFCEKSIQCEEGVNGHREIKQETRSPENTARSQNAKLQILDDDSALESRRVSARNEDISSDSPSNLRKILEVKIVKKELQEDSGGGSSCPAGCERYYHEKLMATLQILENKDETIRIQGSSLGVAEGRIAELSKRASALQAELEHKAQELNKLRQFADSCRVDKSDVSITADMQDAEAQKRVIKTLEDNLAIIADLYRECFYEAAKQEELIELLRKSYLDVRLMEKDKTDKISRLQNVINTQKKSIEQCQDVVIEVESLKSEISSFLNSSNNDSGVWERGSEGGEVGEELADILDQLRQLQDLLTGDCTCGCGEENRTLKERNEALEMQLVQMKERNKELDGALRQLLDQQFEKKIKEKERELQEALERLAAVEKAKSCETVTTQLQQAQVMLNDKSVELAEVQQSCAAHEATIKRLQQELDTSKQQVKEGVKKLEEASRSQVDQQQNQAMMIDLEQRLQRVGQRCRDLEMSCREKQCSLEEAHARGARLCEESRRVTACVREWMRRKRQMAREQQEKIEIQEMMLRDLQRRVVAGQNIPDLTSQSETDPCSSSSIHRNPISSDTSHPRCSRINQASCRSEIAFSRCGPSLARCVERDREMRDTSCSKCESNRQCESERGGRARGTCTFDRGSGSGTARCAQAPVPPRRQKKKQPDDDLDDPCSPRASSLRFPPPASSARPRRGQDARWATLPPPPHRQLRQLSPTAAVLERLEHLHEALERGQRRWGRPRR